MHGRSDGEPRRGAAGRTRALVLTTAALLILGGCAGTAGGGDVTGSPLPTSTMVPEKQAPVVAPSGTATPRAEGGVSVSASPSAAPPEVAGATEDADAAPDAEEPASLDERSERLARELFDLANSARESEGQSALEWSDCAAEQAVDRADTARAKDRLEHEDLEFDCTATVVGENLVRGDGPASALHELWMDSEGHRDNILNGDFDRLGVGCVAHASGDRTEPAPDASGVGGWVCSQMFYG